MEQINSKAAAGSRAKITVKALSLGLAMAVLAFGLMTIAYGLDGVVPGAHDTFHDYRHANGMPCH